MSAVTITSWRAAEFQASVAQKVEHGMELACAMLETEAKLSVSISGDHHGGDPSAPGEPPHLQSGELRAGISHTVDAFDGQMVRGHLGVLASSPANKYARRLELGFAGVDSLGRHYNQAPRPYLRPAVLRNRDRVVELIGKG